MGLWRWDSALVLLKLQLCQIGLVIWIHDISIVVIPFTHSEGDNTVSLMQYFLGHYLEKEFG